MKYDFLIGSKPGISTTFTTSEKNYIEQCLDKLPIQLVNKFYNEGWKLVAYATGSQLPDPDYINSVGAIIPSERNLYAKVSQSSNIFIETIYHEMGHILDINFKQGTNISNAGAEFFSEKYHREEINTLMNTECSDIGSHYLSNHVEFFSKVFEMWMQGNKNIPGKPNTTTFVRKCVEQTRNLNLLFVNQMKQYAITNASISADNRLELRNRYSELLFNISLPSGSNGGGSSEFVFDNNVTFNSAPNDFAARKITISYIEGVHDNNYGVFKVITDRKCDTGSGVTCIQERVFYFGEPNTKPIFREGRYYETNVSYAWSSWFPISEGGGSSYTLPVATTSVLGGVTRGDNVLIEEDGTLSIELATHTIPGVAKFSSSHFNVSGGNVSLKADTIVNKTISGGILTLGTEPYQKCTMADATEIKLPTVTSYTQIELHFNTTSDLTLIFPNVAWQTIPAIKANKDYVIIFIYNGTKWLGGWLEHGV